MIGNKEIRQIDIKNYTFYHFDKLIKIINFSPKNTKVDKFVKIF